MDAILLSKREHDPGTPVIARVTMPVEALALLDRKPRNRKHASKRGMTISPLARAAKVGSVRRAEAYSDRRITHFRTPL